MTASGPPAGELRNTIAAFRDAFTAAGAFSLAINLLLLVPAIYMLQIYDRVLTSRNEVTLAMLTLIMAGLYALEAALELVRSKILIRSGSAIDQRLNGRAFDAAFRQHQLQRRGNPVQALEDLAAVRHFLTGQGLFAFFDAPWTPLYIAVIFLLNPWLGVFALLASLLLLGIAWLNERLTGAPLTAAARIAAAAGQQAANHIRNGEVIAAMGMLDAMRERWLARHRDYLARQAAVSDRAAGVNALARFLRLLLQSAILGLGALLVLDGRLTPGGMIAASILLGRALAPLELAIGSWRGFVSTRAAWQRLDELLRRNPPAPDTLALPRPRGDIAAENLVLGAPGGRDAILKQLNFRVAAGSLVGVIGPSAAGKSTLARALLGIWAPAQGSVRLDGADIHRWDRQRLGPWIGYLPQDVELFEGSIAENIARFGPPDADRVIAAAQRAGVHELILQLPQGYDTVIGPGGAELSGGQRQRIALARALHGDPALVVLDEPNASLDDAGDAALLAALQALKAEQRTVFVMTHRANVLGIVDSVMLLVNGSIQAFGPRDAVMQGLAARAAERAPAQPPRQEAGKP